VSAACLHRCHHTPTAALVAIVGQARGFPPRQRVFANSCQIARASKSASQPVFRRIARRSTGGDAECDQKHARNGLRPVPDYARRWWIVSGDQPVIRGANSGLPVSLVIVKLDVLGIQAFRFCIKSMRVFALGRSPQAATARALCTQAPQATSIGIKPQLGDDGRVRRVTWWRDRPRANGAGFRFSNGCPTTPRPQVGLLFGSSSVRDLKEARPIFSNSRGPSKSAQLSISAVRASIRRSAPEAANADLRAQAQRLTPRSSPAAKPYCPALQ